MGWASGPSLYANGRLEVRSGPRNLTCLMRCKASLAGGGTGGEISSNLSLMTPEVLRVDSAPIIAGMAEIWMAGT